MFIIVTISCVSAIDCDSNSSEIIGDSAMAELSDIHVSPDASDEMGDGSSQNPFRVWNAPSKIVKMTQQFI